MEIDTLLRNPNRAKGFVGCLIRLLSVMNSPKSHNAIVVM